MSKSNESLVKEDVFHTVLEISAVDITTPRIKSPSRKKYLFRQADYQNLNIFFANYDWSFLKNLNLQKAVEMFYVVLRIGIDKFVPQKTISSNHCYPVWYSKALYAKWSELS